MLLLHINLKSILVWVVEVVVSIRGAPTHNFVIAGGGGGGSNRTRSSDRPRIFSPFALEVVVVLVVQFPHYYVCHHHHKSLERGALDGLGRRRHGAAVAPASVWESAVVGRRAREGL